MLRTCMKSVSCSSLTTGSTDTPSTRPQPPQRVGTRPQAGRMKSDERSNHEQSLDAWSDEARGALDALDDRHAHSMACDDRVLVRADGSAYCFLHQAELQTSTAAIISARRCTWDPVT
jgi:hypothetical protein